LQATPPFFSASREKKIMLLLGEVTACQGGERKKELEVRGDFSSSKGSILQRRLLLAVKPNGKERKAAARRRVDGMLVLVVAWKGGVGFGQFGTRREGRFWPYALEKEGKGKEGGGLAKGDEGKKKVRRPSPFEKKGNGGRGSALSEKKRWGNSHPFRKRRTSPTRGRRRSNLDQGREAPPEKGEKKGGLSGKVRGMYHLRFLLRGRRDRADHASRKKKEGRILR